MSDELRPVPGPSALGGGARRSWELLRIIAVADFKRVYFGTALGYLWSLCRPLLLFGVLLAVFTQAFRLDETVPHYPVLLLTGIVVFSFFQEATGAAVGSIVSQESVLRKTQFPRLVVPLAVVATSLFNLLLNLLVVIVFLLAFGIEPRWTWLLVPFVLLAVLVLTTAVAVLVSALYPRFRDLQIIWTVVSTALFYATPVLYPLSAVSERLREVLILNPLAPLFALLHRWLIDADAPTPAALAGGSWRLAVAAAIGVALCAVAAWVFRREAPRVAEAL